MKILTVCCYFYPALAYGGPVTLIYNLAKTLVKKGNQVTVFTTDVLNEKKRTAKRREEIEGINIFRFPTISNWLSWNFRGFVAPPMLLTPAKEIKKFDVVHIFEHYNFPTVIACLWAQKSNVPYIYSPLGSLLPVKERGRQIIKKIFDLFFLRMILNHASFITALSIKEKDHLLSLGVNPGKIMVLPQGIETKPFSSLPQKTEKREVVLLFIGRIYKVKGLDLLVKSLAKLPPETKSRLKTFIIGPTVGDFKGELVQMIKKYHLDKQIVFTGPKFGQEKLNYLAESDIYVQPSYSEGLPVSVLEAMAAGLPVLITEGCHLPEVETSQAGLIVKPHVLTLRRGIQKLFRDKLLREEMGKNGKKLVAEKFSLEKSIQDLERLYNRLAESPAIYGGDESK